MHVEQVALGRVTGAWVSGHSLGVHLSIYLFPGPAEPSLPIAAVFASRNPGAGS